MKNNFHGPWILERSQTYPQAFVFDSEGECVISKTLNGSWGDNKKLIEQLQLVSAAPELLEALTKLADKCDELCRHDRRFDELLDAADSAIAKATGGEE